MTVHGTGVFCFDLFFFFTFFFYSIFSLHRISNVSSLLIDPAGSRLAEPFFIKHLDVHLSFIVSWWVSTYSDLCNLNPWVLPILGMG